MYIDAFNLRLIFIQFMKKMKIFSKKLNSQKSEMNDENVLKYRNKVFIHEG